MRWIAGSLLILLALLLALAARFPANQALAWLQSVAPDLGSEGVEGTVWRGSATRLTWEGYELGALSWSLAPLSILTGRLEATVDVVGEIEASGTLLSDFRGRQIVARSVDCTAPAAWIQHILDAPFLQLEGRLVTSLDRAELRSGFLTALVGWTVWEPARVSGRITTELGGLRVDWSTSGNTVVGEVSDTGGPLQAEGSVVIQNRRYAVDVVLAAADDSVALRQALYVIGQPDPAGRVNLEIHGDLVSIHD